MAAPFIYVFEEGWPVSMLVLFAIGFTAAMAICACGVSVKLAVLLIVFAAALIGVAVCFRRRIPPVMIAVPVLAGFMAAGGWYLLFQHLYLNAAVALDGVTREVTLEVSDYPEESAYGGIVDCRMQIGSYRYQVRVYLDDFIVLEPGDEIAGRFRFRVTTPGGREEATYHQGKGIFLLAYQEGEISCAGGESTSLRHLPAVLRREIGNRLERYFPEDTAAFAKALLLGDGDDLSYETETSFRLSGIRHVIAVSGLHVSILYGMISTVTFKRRFLTALVGLPMLLLFAAVAGFTPSVTRACIMVALMMASLAFNREYDPPTALGFSAVVMLIVNPLTVTSAGWQLSAASVAGIFLFQAPIQSWLMRFFGQWKGPFQKLGTGIASSVAVSLSATILTTPLSAYYFGAVSLVGVLTNLLTLWVISAIFYGIIAVCVVSLFWSAGASLLAWAAAWPVRYVLAVSRFLGGLPMAAVYTRSPYITAWLVFLYVLLAVFLVSRKKHPAMLGCCAVFGLCLALLAGWMEPLLDECRVTVLDVGQGQSILLQSEGKTYLVDCGGDRDDETADIAAETLLCYGVSRLDGIILTHYDRDHSGALENLLTRVDTDLLLLPATDAGKAPDLHDLTDGQVVYVSEDLELTCGGVSITIYAPPFSFESNENSLCILFRTENCDILITGDRSGFGERQLLRHTDLPQVELLIVGHHGSKYSTCEELLAEVMPETAIISVGESNPYGHPTREVLDRLTAIGCTVYRTDLNGTIVYRR